MIIGVGGGLEEYWTSVYIDWFSSGGGGGTGGVVGEEYWTSVYIDWFITWLKNLHR